MSLRRRLLAILLGALSLIWLLLAMLSLRGAVVEVDELFDNQLRQVAATLFTLDLDQLEVAVDVPGFDQLDSDDVFGAIWWDDGGRVLFRSAFAPPLAGAPAQDGLSSVEIAGARWRIYRARDRRHGRYLAVMRPLHERDELVAQLALGLFGPWALSLPALALLLWFGIRHAMRPLDRLSAELAARPADELTPLDPRRAPSEVHPLLRALNGLLERLARMLAYERRFIADASHELRTPLAALRVLAEVAATAPEAAQREAALRRLGEGAERISALVERLLTLARLDPLTAPPQTATVDLVEVARQALAERAVAVLAERVELALEGDERAAVAGDAALLERLVGNLVDNAAAHSPAGATVTVTVRREADAVALEVRDQGEGVPADSLPRLGERFWRLDPSRPGSGLGLSIVRRIAELHGAELSFRNDGGLRATARFPAARQGAGR